MRLLLKPYKREYYWDYFFIKENLREIDKKEVLLSGTNMEEWIGDKNQKEVYIGYIEENTFLIPVLIYGIYSVNHEWGNVIWCIGTDDIKKCTRDFIVKSKEQIDKWKKEYGSMWNYVLTENTKSIKWLTHMGASWGEPLVVNGNEWVFFQLKGE